VTGDAGLPPLKAGVELAPGYRVLEHLHRSRSYDVYGVWSAERCCRCIAKTPAPDMLEKRSARNRLLREGRLLGRLTHPHFVRLYEALKEPQPVLILETLTGETLAHLIHRRGRRLPLREIAYLGLHLCSAMHYLHRHGLLHLDLKPSNIISQPPLAKVIDLSIARPPGRGRSGVGTVPYMSPEQARGGHLTAAADVWGIGVVLYEAATGRRAFPGSTGSDTEHEARYEQLERRADPVREHRRVPPAFAAAVDRCLEPAPADRPAVGELFAQLDRLLKS
jgi:serine/threonine protein kinase